MAGDTVNVMYFFVPSGEGLFLMPFVTQGGSYTRGRDTTGDLMSLARCLLAALSLAGALAGCAVDVGPGVGNSAVPRCDRNGDAEQQIACVR